MPTLIARTHNEAISDNSANGGCLGCFAGGSGKSQTAVRQARRARQAGGKLRVWATCEPGRAVHTFMVWAGRLSSTGKLAQRQSVAWVGAWGRAAPAQVLAAGVPLSFASRPARLTVAMLMPKCSAVCEMLAWLAVRHATISAGWCVNGRPIDSLPR